MNTKKSDVNPAMRAAGEPIAIIGIGCRFPGADGPDAFWNLLKDGADAVKDIPRDRFDIDAVYDSRPGTPGKIISRMGGFLDRVDQFDARFFGISPREAMRMDPQQRLLLEVTWEAFEDAGQQRERFAGAAVGVFIGACTSDYADIQYYLRSRSEIDLYVSTGTARSVMSGRLSYVFDLCGPSVTVDTACSSSLVAVHLACRSLWSGECGMALAGGVNLILQPEMTMSFSRARMLAPDSRCKFGDATADGFARSDGVAVVVLKPLSMAMADGDPIYALVRGTAANNDGRGSGLLATPSRRGQEAVLRQAYANAGISPGDVRYVEAHGTGTSVGDPVEVESLGAVLAHGRRKERPCRIGSVKTNIGHTEGAAGIAGLIKTALCLKHKIIPRSLHFETPNPNIAWGELPVEASRELSDWPTDSGPAIAGVSAFGISGTNAHVVLEEAPKRQEFHESAASDSGAHLMTLSAQSAEALVELAKSWREFIAGGAPPLRDVCYTANTRRSHLDHRVAIVGRTHEEMVERLDSFFNEETAPGMSQGYRTPSSKRRLVFVFPGQGSQWIGMGRSLLQEETAFRGSLEQSDQAIKRHAGWSPLEALTGNVPIASLDQIDVIQPCLFAIQVALATLWRSWGVEPDAIAGQSMGEVAAAHCSGALTLEDAARVICRRSLILKKASGQGGMLVVGLSADDALEAIIGYEDRVSVAVSSGPASTVLSGDKRALVGIARALSQLDIFCQEVKVDVASHSPMMDPLRDDLLKALEGLKPDPPSIPIYSTVTGGDESDYPLFDATYWVRNLREPVLFAPVIKKLAEAGHDIFMEISPEPVLATPIHQMLNSLNRSGKVLPSMRSREPERDVMLGSLGALHTAGFTIDFDRLYPSRGRIVRLPSPRWQRERFWLGEDREIRLGHEHVGQRQPNPSPWNCGVRLKSAAHPNTYFWEVDLSTDRLHYLNDHRVQGAAVLPAAAYVDMVFTAAASLPGEGVRVLEDMKFHKAVFLKTGKIQRLQLVISNEMHGRFHFQVFALESEDNNQSGVPHATGVICLGGTQPPGEQERSPESIYDRCSGQMSRAEYYGWLAERGLEYGPHFQGLEQVRRGQDEAIARLCMTEEMAAEGTSYRIHPAFLDACLQVLAATVPGVDAYLPVGVDSLRIYTETINGVWTHARLSSNSNAGDTLKGDVQVFDEDGRVALEVQGVTMRRLAPDGDRCTTQGIDDLLYEIAWRPTTLSPAHPSSRPDDRGVWIIFSDRSGIGEMLVESLESRGETCITIGAADTYRSVDEHRYQIDPLDPYGYRRVLDDVRRNFQSRIRGAVHLWSLEIPSYMPSADVPQRAAIGCASVMHLVQAAVSAFVGEYPRLWLVTAGAQQVGDRTETLSVAQSALWGLGRVVSYEHPEFQCTLIDLGSEPSPEEARSLSNELLAGDAETQVALRGAGRYAARLARHCVGAIVQPPRKGRTEAPLPNRAFRLEALTSGNLDSLTLRPMTRRKPGPDEVEIGLRSLALNFRDVMLALGMLPADPGTPEALGWDCAGRITSLGENVEGLEVGDEVFAIANPCFASHAITNKSLVLRKSAHISFDEAAATPIALLTAYYSMHVLARLQQGERVLIHSATGGVGLAAVQLAQHLKAEVFVTAGSLEKRRFLESLGVKHIFDSRSLAFADEIRKVTYGGGIDVVLNSLAGEAIPAGISVLRAGGRFLELGKRDILQNAQLALGSLRNNLSFFAIDLALLIRQQPAFVGSVLRDAVQLYERIGRSLPLTVFPLSEAEHAFRFVAQGKHIGKVAISVDEPGEEVGQSFTDAAPLRPDGTYLVTGGLGGLGLKVAQWMAEQGARNLVLMGRSDPSSTAFDALEALKERARVVVFKGDVSRRDEVAAVLAQIESTMPPLRGIVHGAGVLDDGILAQMDSRRLEKVMAPKILGSWNLHILTKDAPLDFFVLFSSAASMLGSAGQGNYSAANAFMDGLACYRRLQCLPGLSVNWGSWSDVGLAARPDRAGRLSLRGIRSIRHERCLQALGRLIEQGPAQVGVMSLDFERWSRTYPVSRDLPFFADLKFKAQEDGPSANIASKGICITREMLMDLDQAEREEMLRSYIGRRLARVLGLSASSLVKLDVQQPLIRFGVDSLMAVELRTRIEADLHVTIPVVSFLNGSSVAQLAQTLLEKLDGEMPCGPVDNDRFEELTL